MKKQLFFLIALTLPVFTFSQSISTLKNGGLFDCKYLNVKSKNLYSNHSKNRNIISTTAGKEINSNFRYGSTLKPENDKDLSLNQVYQDKIKQYTKMKNTGIGLGAGGAIITVVGIFLASNADWEQVENEDSMNSNNTTYNTTSGSGIAGVLCIIGGVSMGVTGIILGTIGSNNVKKYQNKLKKVSVNISYTQKQRGFTLAYRF